MHIFVRFLVTVFGFTKVRIYLTLTDSTFCMNCLYQMLNVIIFIYGAVVLTRVCLTEAGPLEIKGMYLCNNPEANFTNSITIIMMTFFFICTNSAFIIIFYKVRNLQHDRIPELSSQMKSNLFIIPFIFLTTVIIGIFTLIWFTRSSHDSIQKYIFVPTVV